MSQSKRSMFNEVRTTHTPGEMFCNSFCWDCNKTKKTKGGKRNNALRRFTCADCLAGRPIKPTPYFRDAIAATASTNS